MHSKKSKIILSGILLLLVFLGVKLFTRNALKSEYINTIEDNNKWKKDYLFDLQTSSLIYTEDSRIVKIINLSKNSNSLDFPDCDGYSYIAPGKYLILNCNKIVLLSNYSYHPLNRIEIDYAHTMNPSRRVELLNSFNNFINSGDQVYTYSFEYFNAYLFIGRDRYALFDIFEADKSKTKILTSKRMLSTSHASMTFDQDSGVIKYPYNQILSFFGADRKRLTIQNITDCFLETCSVKNKVTYYTKDKSIPVSLGKLDGESLKGIVQLKKENKIYFLGNKEIKVFSFEEN